MYCPRCSKNLIQKYHTTYSTRPSFYSCSNCTVLVYDTSIALTIGRFGITVYKDKVFIRDAKKYYAPTYKVGVKYEDTYLIYAATKFNYKLTEKQIEKLWETIKLLK